MEDYREGERIREYKIEGLIKGKWVELVNGKSVGRKKIDYFEEVEVTAVRLLITRAAAKPLIRSFSTYYVEDFIPFAKDEGLRVWAKPVKVASWNENMFKEDKVQMEIDLSNYINVPGQYTLNVFPESETEFTIDDPALYYEGNRALDEFLVVTGNKININQTAQITDKSNIKVQFFIESDTPTKGRIEFKPALIY